MRFGVQFLGINNPRRADTFLDSLSENIHNTSDCSQTTSRKMGAATVTEMTVVVVTKDEGEGGGGGRCGGDYTRGGEGRRRRMRNVDMGGGGGLTTERRLPTAVVFVVGVNGMWQRLMWQRQS